MFPIRRHLFKIGFGQALVLLNLNSQFCHFVAITAAQRKKIAPTALLEVYLPQLPP